MKKMICVFLAAVMSLSLAGCSFGFGTPPKDADKYTAGNAEIKGKVESLEIEWTMGRLDIVQGKGNAVVLEESYSGELPDEKKMHWYLDGTTLKVRYDMLTGPGVTAEKSLTVTVPEDLHLKEVTLSVISANMNAVDLSADAAEVAATSGDVTISFRDALTEGSFAVTSGDLKTGFSGPVGKLAVSTVSGDLQIDAGDRIGELKVSSVSGDLTADLDEAPGNTRIETTSGDIEMTLPGDADLSLEYETVSGELRSEVAFANEGDTYISGSGENPMHISTVSGKITILKS